MHTLIFISGCSFFACLLLTPVIRDVFRALGIMDQPGDPRKVHTRGTPRIGGIPIAISYLLGYAVLLALPVEEKGMLERHLPLVWKLLPSAGLVFATGLIDDLIDLKPWQKLVGQLGAAVLAVMAGVRMASIEGQALSQWWSIPLTVVWLIACTNAFNLIDGIDGLASGAGLFATTTILVSALLTNSPALALATFPLAACLLAFLVYNFNPASIFLGDCGSLLIGFLLGCFGILWSQKSVTMVGMTAPMMAMAIPLLDTALCIGRRYLRNKPLFAGDRGHIHHKLLDRGLTPRRAALSLYGMCGIAATFSLLTSVSRPELSGAILILFCAAAWVGVQSLGYDEFGTAGAMVRTGIFRKMLNAHLELRTFEADVRRSVSVDLCWEALRDAARRFGFDGVTTSLKGRRYEARFLDTANRSSWSVRVELDSADFVQLSSSLGTAKKPVLVGMFCESIAACLGPKLSVLPQSRTVFSHIDTTASLLNLAAAGGQSQPAKSQYSSDRVAEPA